MLPSYIALATYFDVLIIHKITVLLLVVSLCLVTDSIIIFNYGRKLYLTKVSAILNYLHVRIKQYVKEIFSRNERREHI